MWTLGNISYVILPFSELPHLCFQFDKAWSKKISLGLAARNLNHRVEQLSVSSGIIQRIRMFPKCVPHKSPNPVHINLIFSTFDP